MSPIIQQLRSNKKLIKPLVLLVLFIVVFIIARIIFKPNFTKYNFINTHLTTENNFAVLNDNNILSYNGASFVKTPIGSTQPSSIIYASGKLPKPKNIFWADEKGVLLNFEESFIATNIETELTRRGLSVNNQTRLYTWYLDFKTTNITLISPAPVLNNLAYYSEKNNGFYFVPDPSSLENDESEGSSPLLFYNLATGALETPASNLSLTAINHVGACPDESFKICVVGRSFENPKIQKVIGINTNSAIKSLFESNLKILPTSNPNLYLTIGQSGLSSLSNADIVQGEASINNIKSGKKADLKFEISGDGSAAMFSADGSFYILDNSITPLAEKEEATEYEYRSGSYEADKNKVRSRSYTASLGADAYTSKLISKVSYGNKNQSLISSYNGEQLLFSSTNDIKFNMTDINEAKKAVQECAKNSLKASQYFESEKTFRVFFADNGTVGQQSKEFINCVSKKNSQLLTSYNYYFGTVDLVNGRLTSD